MTLNEQSLFERSYASYQFLVAAGLILTLLVMNVISPPFTSALSLKAPLFMMTVYYWSTFHPPIMPSWLCFAGGLLLDCLTLTPIGTQALILTGLRQFTQSQRIYISHQPFIIYWLIFALFYAGALALTALSVSPASLPSLWDHHAIIGFCANLCLFPAIFTLLHASHKFILQAPPSPLDRKRKKILTRRGKKGGL